MIIKVDAPYQTNLVELSCSKCSARYDANQLLNTSPCCGAVFLCEYSYNLERSQLRNRPWTLWRYYEMLPVKDPDNIISLGEGGTPLITLQSGFGKLKRNIVMKDESLNPTGSFKARGMSVAISKAKELGVKKCIIPSAGNAGVAMAAYCLKAGIKATVVFPSITPRIYIENCRAYGAEVVIAEGLIDECGKVAQNLNKNGEYFNVSTLREPYRLEGKKIMGYEIAEAMSWKLPDYIVYPTGGGTGLVGIWKAINEMVQLGWISGSLPKMVAIQTDRCSPVVDKWNNKESDLSRYSASCAHGLNVPAAFGMDLILRCLNESEGTAISVSETEIKSGQQEIFNNDGILISPEGAAAFAGIRKLVERGFINNDKQVLMLNTGGVYSADD